MKRSFPFGEKSTDVDYDPPGSGATLTRTVAVYIGSSDDLPPAIFYPEYDWVFITSEGTGYWGSHLIAHRLETMEGFVTALNKQLPGDL
jgi:hypothetical protein